MWISMLVVLIVPFLVTLDSGRSWLLSSPRCVFVWIMLTAAAAVGLLERVHLLGANVSTGRAVLVATPFLQAVVFVVANWLFGTMNHRPPVPMEQARRGRRPDGRLWWPDMMFWALVTFGTMGGAVILCASFGVEFPSRGHVQH
jgi:hypothetical protein